jgi:hypothetical protein
VRVFVSSPGDVADERRRVRAVIERLGKDPSFRNHLKLDPILWDDPEAPAPMLANLPPQESVNRGLVRPSDCDIVVTIFWGRMGTPLQKPLKADGTAYLSGTEWEYEDARHAKRDILLYRRNAPVPTVVGDPSYGEKTVQRERVDSFFKRLQGGYTRYEKPEEFAKLVEANLRNLIVRLLETTNAAPRNGPASPGERGRFSDDIERRHRTRIFGRKRLVNALTDRVLQNARRPIGILGGPGIGKTTIAQALCQQPQIKTRFGDDVLFVPCDAVRSAEVLAQALCRALGVEPGDGESALTVFIRELQDDPTLLVIDNLETPWEAEHGKIEQLLQTLAHIPNVSLIVTMRGSELPSGADWEDPLVVRPLAIRAARELFLDEAKNRTFAKDPLLDAVLRNLEGWPLAIVLLANNTRGEPSLQTVMDRWKIDGSRIFDLESPEPLLRTLVDNHQDSLSASIAISIDSRRMTDDGRRMLSILARLPEGVRHRDLDSVLPGRGHGAASILRKLSLVFDRDERLSLLSPIRECVLERLPCLESDLQHVMAFYRRLLAEYSLKASPEGAAACIERLQPEMRNIEASIEHALVDDRDAAIAASFTLAHVMRFTGLGTTAFLEKVLNATASN